MGKRERERIKKILGHAQEAIDSGNRIPTLRDESTSMGIRHAAGQDKPTSREGWPMPLPVGAPTGAAPGTTLDPDLDWIIGKESSGLTTAKNKESSAFGLGQLLKGNRAVYASKLGIKNPDTTDFGEQLRMMQAYIKDRYGTSAKAKAFHEKNGWY